MDDIILEEIKTTLNGADLDVNTNLINIVRPIIKYESSILKLVLFAIVNKYPKLVVALLS